MLGFADISFFRYMPDILFDWFSKYSTDHQNYLRVLHGFTEMVISTRRKEMQNNSDESKVTPEGSKRKKLAFLDLLLNLQLSGGDDELTNQDIREEVCSFTQYTVLVNKILWDKDFL